MAEGGDGGAVCLVVGDRRAAGGGVVTCEGSRLSAPVLSEGWTVGTKGGSPLAAASWSEESGTSDGVINSGRSGKVWRDSGSNLVQTACGPCRGKGNCPCWGENSVP